MVDSNGNYVTYTLSLPYFEDMYSPSQQTLMLDGTTITPTLLADVTLMAKSALGENITEMAIRQLLRVVAKDKLRKELARNDTSGVTNLLANVYNTVTEQADTRSWQTLPDTVGIYSKYLSEGKHNVDIGGHTINVPVKAGRTSVVWLSRQGQSVAYWQGILGEL
ncbi:hypothetical protein [Veronia nyctiphanis]|uniref:hypothetical protein n=1 Tax=Veronia nyctiphanis TaxID=1278244 RepID=UPI001F426FA6|nr:hypothetical protein [Veronia nyctiphanis]